VINLFGRTIRFALILLFFVLLLPPKIAAKAVDITFIYKDGCPYCEAENDFLNKISADYELNIERLDIYSSRDRGRYDTLAKEYNFTYGFTPVVIVGDQYYLGFNTEQDSGQQIIKLIDGQVSNKNLDEAGCSINSSECANENYQLPLFGQKNLKSLSLPILTLVVGLADGFNPCAMWALIALLGFLVSLKSRKKLIFIGGAFLVASFVSSFLFIAMWYGIFNVVNKWLAILGTAWVKYFEIVVAIFALIVAIKLIVEFWQNKNLECEVGDAKKKSSITMKLKEVAKDKNMLAAIFGAVVLAIGVNIIEAMCSIGLPVVYTSILNNANLSLGSALSYITAYNVFYMADDILIFLAIVLTNKVIFASKKIGKVAKIVLAIILLVTAYNLVF